MPPGKLEGTTTVTFQAIVPEESLVVKVTSSNYVTLELNFDENPSEVGWFLVADNDEMSRSQPVDTAVMSQVW